MLDATPAYMRKPIVADRLVELLPQAAQPKLKFVVILRECAHVRLAEIAAAHTTVPRAVAAPR